MQVELRFTIDGVRRTPATHCFIQSSGEHVHLPSSQTPPSETAERAARELCVSLKRDPDALLGGEALWRQYVEMAVSAIDSWKELKRG